MTSPLRPATGPISTGPISPGPRRRAGSRCCRWRRPNSTVRICPLGTDVMIAQAYLARVRELLPDSVPGDVPAAAAGRDFHRTYRLSGHADAADGSGAEELDGARRKRRARRHQKARDGDEPWRQQRRDDAGGAGSARAARASRGHHELVALQRGRRGCSPRKNCVTASMAARSKPRSCWRDIRNSVRREEIADFPSRQHRDGKGLSLAFGAAAGAVCLAGAGPASERRGRRCDAWPPPRKANSLLDHGARAFCELLAEVDNFDP